MKGFGTGALLIVVLFAGAVPPTVSARAQTASSDDATACESLKNDFTLDQKKDACRRIVSSPDIKKPRKAAALMRLCAFRDDSSGVFCKEAFDLDASLMTDTNLGLSELGKGDADRARRFFEEGCRKDEVEACENLASGLAADKRYVEAYEAINKAMARDGRSFTYFARASIEYRLGEYYKASEDLDRFRTLDAMTDVERRLLGKLRIYLGNNQEGVDILDALKVELTYEELMIRGIARWTLGRYAQAAEDFAAAADKAPGGLYPRMWQAITAMSNHTGFDLGKVIHADPHFDPATWPGPLALYLAGEKTEADVFAAARGVDASERDGDRCEADVYTVLKIIVRSSNPPAASDPLFGEVLRKLREAHALCPKTFFEYPLVMSDMFK